MGMSKTETSIRNHISDVSEKLSHLINILYLRSKCHDSSKLTGYEFKYWQDMDNEPKVPYGSQAYFDKIKRFKNVFTLHYRNNPHHPEFYHYDFGRMDLLDLTEMLCDWISYMECPTPLELIEKITYQVNRFNIPKVLGSILSNTAIRYFSTESISGVSMTYEDLLMENKVLNKLTIDEFNTLLLENSIL